ncbi:MAG: cell division protein ZapA [Bacteroidetes bacterium]|jgi:cell division protein ZapA|nr:cell division protein ZapA [Bacteroidota bacterium]MDF1864764.1 cell division protein ZapA [Saprospiraceae bacterium]
MEAVETKQITVTIAGRPYPLKISARDESAIRKLVKEVNEKINRFQLNYAKRDKQDSLAMAILTYAVDLQVAKQKNTTQDQDLSDKLSQLDELLSNLMK